MQAEKHAGMFSDELPAACCGRQAKLIEKKSLPAPGKNVEANLAFHRIDLGLRPLLFPKYSAKNVICLPRAL